LALYISFFILSYQSEFGHHFSCFCTYVFHRYAISLGNSCSYCYSSYSTSCESGHAPLCQDRKAHNMAGATQQDVGDSMGGTVCTSCADGKDIDRPRSLGITTSMHNGASNSGCVCLACCSSSAPQMVGSPCQALRLGSGSEPLASTIWMA
jgi:hypothetical protein